MHNTATTSRVSDAITQFAGAPLAGAASTAARAAAAAALTKARAVAAEAADVAQQFDALLGFQGSAASNARVAAWVLGAVLAKQAEFGVAAPVLAAVIAAGGKLGSSEDDLSAAAAVGIEVAQRLLSAVDSAEFRARWNVASALGIIGAVVATSRLYQLDAVCMNNAMGVAATQAAGLCSNAGQAMEPIEVGKAAADALEATLLAKHGFTSAPASIDGRRGLAALMAYRFDADALIAGLGEQWVSVA